MNVSTTDQTIAKQGVKVMIYGNAGAGKTVLAATAPRPLIIQAESGSLSLAPANLNRIFGAGNPEISYSIPLLTVRTFQQFESALTYVCRPEVWAHYETLYIDSMSEIAESILKHELAANRDGRMAFGEMAERVISLIKQMRDMPEKNVILTFKQGLCADSALMGPSLPGKMLDREIPYLFDEVLRLAIAETPEGRKFRWLQTESCNQYYGKDRSGALDPKGEPAFLKTIFAKMR